MVVIIFYHLLKPMDQDHGEQDDEQNSEGVEDALTSMAAFSFMAGLVVTAYGCVLAQQLAGHHVRRFWPVPAAEILPDLGAATRVDARSSHLPNEPRSSPPLPVSFSEPTLLRTQFTMGKKRGNAQKKAAEHRAAGEAV